jgi:predicted nucleotidyltransferase
MKQATEIALELKEKLKKYDDFVGLYLYGSQVTGKAKEDSDIDIVAVFNKDDENSFSDVLGDAFDVELENDIILDFHPMTIEELNLDWFYFNEIKKGFYYAR